MPPISARRQIQHDVRHNVSITGRKPRPRRRPAIGAVIEHAGKDARIVGAVLGPM